MPLGTPAFATGVGLKTLAFFFDLDHWPGKNYDAVRTRVGLPQRPIENDPEQGDENAKDGDRQQIAQLTATGHGEIAKMRMAVPAVVVGDSQESQNKRKASGPRTMRGQLSAHRASVLMERLGHFVAFPMR